MFSSTVCPAGWRPGADTVSLFNFVIELTYDYSFLFRIKFEYYCSKYVSFVSIQAIIFKNAFGVRYSLVIFFNLKN